jgi:predicted metal-dependent phosphoesterase TrpH
MARVDLHCHTSASFDGVAEPVAVVARALERGLTHVAITDHDTIDGALAAREGAPPGITVIVGSEVLTTEGDLVFLFLREALPTGLSAREAIEAGRRQGALVGIPHPYDRTRRSLLRDDACEPLVDLVDWVETVNARVGRQAANRRAVELAASHALPGIGVSDAHALIEVGRTHTVMTGDPGSPEGLLAALRGPLSIVQAEPHPSPRSPIQRLLRRGTRPVESRR